MKPSFSHAFPSFFSFNIYQTVPWLVVSTLWKIWKSTGMIIPNIWENRKMFQSPPTSNWLSWDFTPWLSIVEHRRGPDHRLVQAQHWAVGSGSLESQGPAGRSVSSPVDPWGPWGDWDEHPPWKCYMVVPLYKKLVNRTPIPIVYDITIVNWC